MPKSISKLEIFRDGDFLQEFSLNQDSVVIGRTEDNDLMLSDPTISRHHLQIVRDTDGYLVTDLGSTHKTRLNQTRLVAHQPQRLSDDDMISLGSFELRFCAGEMPNLPARSPDQTTDQTTKTGLKLLQITTPQGTREFLLDRPELTLGRGSQCDLVIDYPTVALQQAQLHRLGNDYLIVNLDAYMGLTHQGYAITQKLLVPGDVIAIGAEVTLTYQAEVLPDIHIPISLWGRDTLTFGRDVTNDIVIAHSSVSRFHARIERQGHALIMTDLASTNGTFVNGQRLTSSQILSTTDSIQIGPCRLAFYFEDS
jgi:pSer/pThr/pTyr-binding forkhead associated (FHA) protein